MNEMQTFMRCIDSRAITIKDARLVDTLWGLEYCKIQALNIWCSCYFCREVCRQPLHAPFQP